MPKITPGFTNQPVTHLKELRPNPDTYPSVYLHGVPVPGPRIYIQADEPDDACDGDIWIHL